MNHRWTSCLAWHCEVSSRYLLGNAWSRQSDEVLGLLRWVLQYRWLQRLRFSDEIRPLVSLDSVEDVQSCSATKELCSSGQISGFAATSCQQCALGSFAGSPGMSACELCLAGTYGQLGDTEKRRALYARVCQCV